MSKIRTAFFVFIAALLFAGAYGAVSPVVGEWKVEYSVFTKGLTTNTNTAMTVIIDARTIKIIPMFTNACAYQNDGRKLSFRDGGNSIEVGYVIKAGAMEWDSMKLITPTNQKVIVGDTGFMKVIRLKRK